MNDAITVRGARQHNLQNIDVRIPRNRFVVITGPSGSGKSSLAFDTIFAEGYRRYVESLSVRARQWLERLARPDFDTIEGLSPSIGVRQSAPERTSRSTVGTMTEIYDLMRLLWARWGEPHCPTCDRRVTVSTVPEVVDRLVRLPEGTRLQMFAPRLEGTAADLRAEIDRLRSQGFVRVRVNGSVVDVGEDFPLGPARGSHRLDVLIDRLVVKPGVQQRLSEAVELAYATSDGVVVAEVPGAESMRFFERPFCADCTMSLPVLEPALFSFNHPTGMCSGCGGRGWICRDSSETTERRLAQLTAAEQRFDAETVERVEQELQLHAPRETCPSCGGLRLRSEALAVSLGGIRVAEWVTTDGDRLATRIRTMDFGASVEAARPILEEVGSRLAFLTDMGLGYLSLQRDSRSLSTGEYERLRLSNQLGRALSGVLYVLDEPSVGLHARDHQRLVQMLTSLRDRGNTVLVVEHDLGVIGAADYVVDLGPGAGSLGGRILAAGTPDEVARVADSPTGRYLSGRRSIEVPPTRRSPGRGSICVRNASAHNLRGVAAAFPLGALTCVTGVSGSGKSSLVMETLVPALGRGADTRASSGAAVDLPEGARIDRVVVVDASPVGRTPRSTPATYAGFFGAIRAHFAHLPEARARGYGAERFSLNRKGGRCEACQGHGVVRFDMQFLADTYVPCQVCGGTRYGRDALEVRYRGLSIADVLALPVDEALTFFSAVPRIHRALDVLHAVGLGYLELGRPATSLSGGEAQRLKLARELAKTATEATVIVLDEPTRGLHLADIEPLLAVINQLVDRGTTAIVIEHHLEVIKVADHVIDLGPEAGAQGGRVVVEGSPERVASCADSHTGLALRSVLPDSTGSVRNTKKR